MRIAAFGLSITSSWGNGHATVYRGLFAALNSRGHEIEFFEQEQPYYRSNQDLWDPPYCTVHTYRTWDEIEPLARVAAREADVILVCSYCFDGINVSEWITRFPDKFKVYYDIDTPVTLTALDRDGQTSYIRANQIKNFDLVLSFTGGPALDELLDQWGAKRAKALYCGVDPEMHKPQPVDPEFKCDLGYMGTYAADRQQAVESFLIRPARQLLGMRFILAGPQYPEGGFPPNLKYITHLPPERHSSFYSSSFLQLNATRGAMVRYGYSPSVRVFEAAASGACLVTDVWAGMDECFQPERELIQVRSTEEVIDLLQNMTNSDREEIGHAARQRVLRDHTFEVRARQFEEAVGRVVVSPQLTH